MKAIAQYRWSDEVDDYVVDGFEIHVCAEEMLMIEKWLKIIANYEGANGYERKIAKDMIAEIRW